MTNFDIASHEVRVEGVQQQGGGACEGGISICQNSKTCIKTLRNNLDFFIKQNNKLKLEMKQTFNAAVAEAEAAQRRQWQPTSGKLEPTHTHTYTYRERHSCQSVRGEVMGRGEGEWEPTWRTKSLPRCGKKAEMHSKSNMAAMVTSGQRRQSRSESESKECQRRKCNFLKNPLNVSQKKLQKKARRQRRRRRRR